MESLTQSLSMALSLLVGMDAPLLEVIWLSLTVSFAAVLFASLIGFPLGALVAVGDFPGRRLATVALNALVGLPAVVVGLLAYLMLSRSGPLGSLGLLFTPTAMVIAQTILITPLVAALARQVIEDAWREYREQLISLGATRPRASLTLLWDTRFSLATVVLVGFGRAVAEVGTVMIVGGNIAGVTRTMTTTIALETSKGDLPLALALGMVLVGVVFLMNGMAYLMREWSMRRYG